MHDAEVSWPCRVRQKPKMEIVLTKSAEFDAIVAEENEPNAGDFGEYYGAHASKNSCSAFSHHIVTALLFCPCFGSRTLHSATAAVCGKARG